MNRLTSLALLATLAGPVGGCGPDEGASAQRPPLVRTVTLGATSGGAKRYTGTVRARTESALGFRVGGKVAERLVDPGQRVRRGQPLMRLDKADLALANGSAQAAAEAARAQMTKSAADEKRSRKLASQGWVSQAGYEGAKAAADAAAAQFAAIEAQAAQAQNQLLYAELQADADGLVTEVTGEPGQVVAAGQPLVKVARDGAREAEIFLPEGSERAAETEATARLYTDRETSFPARFRELAGVADPATRTYRARYVLGGAGETAPLGATVTVELGAPLRGGAGRREVPLGAVFDNGEGTAVWRVDEAAGTVSAQPVTVTRLGPEEAEIQSNLRDGERIVALGAHLLKNGQRVRLAPSQVAGQVAAQVAGIAP